MEAGKKLPILYYIHGGGFNTGSNRGNFKNLVLEQEVMAISIAYRLGIYGFLYSPNTESDQEFSQDF